MAQSSIPHGTEGTPGTVVRSNKVRACAECRRLKLRCDRNIPCQSCIRRGCTALCPDKCFTDEATPSSLKATSLRNREQIQLLSQRVAALEEALASAHPSHELLEQRSLPMSTSSSTAPPSRSRIIDQQNTIEETIDIFGSLSVGEDGSPVYHGATSMSEHFLRKSVPGPTDPRNLLLTGKQPDLPSSIQLLSALFPFAPLAIAGNCDINEMLPYLPAAPEALDITNRYWHHFSMGCAPICRQQFIRKIHNHFYPHNVAVTHLEPSDAHRLGVLYITLALGVLTDHTKPMLSTEAETYHQLARACLSLDPICEKPTLHGLQCMVSIVWYVTSAPTRSSPGYLWAFSGVVLKLGSSIGIFRDSRKWLTDIDEIEQREVVCWELLGLEVWRSFSSGRPCNVDFSLIDCQRPPKHATPSWGLHGFVHGYDDWRYRLIPIINNILLVVQRPTPVKYAEILDLELQLRTCSMPEDLSIPMNVTPNQRLPVGNTTEYLQRLIVLIQRELACCLLHRRFLILAMQETDESTKAPYWYSALQAGYSACCIVGAHIIMYRRHPGLISRMPIFWSTSFSAAVVLGAIAARYWNRDFARGTLDSFEQICALYEEAAGTSIQPLNGLEVLRRLRERVHAHFTTSSDAVKSFNDLPLLGAHPSMTNCVSSRPPITTTVPVASEGESASPPTISGSSSIDPSPPCSMAGNPVMASMGQTFFHSISSERLDAIWPVPDLESLNDNSGSSIFVTWPDSQVTQPTSLLDGLSNVPVEDLPSVGPFNTENQFLDRLGIWE